MTKHKGGLGRGLDALLGDLPQTDDGQDRLSSDDNERVAALKLTDIDPNREQPRKHFNEEALTELADSIRSVGVIQPILVCENGARYTIIAGERRWRAARMAGLTEIPAIVRNWDEVHRLEVALIENLQRDDLNPVEEARGINHLMEQCGLTQEQAAERLGRSRPAVANQLRLLTLPKQILALLEEGKLSAGHARALITVDRSMQLRLAQLAVAQNWSVRQLERICAQQNESKQPVPEKPPRDPEFKRLERMARDVFGTRAELTGDENKGKLIVHYKNSEDLQHIWDVLEIINRNEV